MNQYNNYIENLEGILYSFIKKGKIESEKTEIEINKLDEILKKEQFEILYSPLSDENQNVIFNALRNLRLVIIEIKDQLKTALERKENPTTAKRCIALMPFITNLFENIYVFKKNRNDSLIIDISRNTRILRKKAREFNLVPSIEKEMEEIELSNEEIKSFCDGFNETIQLEMQEL